MSDQEEKSSEDKLLGELVGIRESIDRLAESVEDLLGEDRLIRFEVSTKEDSFYHRRREWLDRPRIVTLLNRISGAVHPNHLFR